MIETAQDYNERLSHCGCCPPYLCPTPEIKKEFQSVFVESQGYTSLAFGKPIDLPEDTPFSIELWGCFTRREFRTSPTASESFTLCDGAGENCRGKQTYSGTGFVSRITTWDGAFETLKCGSLVHSSSESNSYSGTITHNKSSFVRSDPADPFELDSKTVQEVTHVGAATNNLYEIERTVTDYSVDPPSVGAPTTISSSFSSVGGTYITPSITEAIYSEKTNFADWLTGALAEMVPGECWAATTSRNARFRVFEPVSFAGNADVDKDFIRIRFKIPSSHLGSYFKITYDIGEFPTTGDPSFFSEDNVIEWTGPGIQGDPDDDSWFTPWVEIDPPDVPGERRIVNIRYVCRHGVKFPALPQVMGEALVIPAP